MQIFSANCCAHFSLSRRIGMNPKIIKNSQVFSIGTCFPAVFGRRHGRNGHKSCKVWRRTKNTELEPFTELAQLQMQIWHHPPCHLCACLTPKGYPKRNDISQTKTLVSNYKFGCVLCIFPVSASRDDTGQTSLRLYQRATGRPSLFRSLRFRQNEAQPR